MPSSLARSLLAVAAVALALTGCTDDDTDSAATTVDSASDTGSAVEEASGVRVVSPEDAAELLADDPDITIVDVRTPEEHAEARIEGSTLVDIQSPEFEERIAELDRDGSYVLYCRSGNRSAQARQLMAELGFRDVADVDGGIVAWMDAGLPVVPG